MIIRLVKLLWRTVFDVGIILASMLRELGAPSAGSGNNVLRPDTDLWPYDLVIDKRIYNDIMDRNGNVTLEWGNDYIVGVVIGYNGKYLDRVKVAFLNGSEISHPIIKIYHVRELMKLDSPVKFLTSMAQMQRTAEAYVGSDIEPWDNSTVQDSVADVDDDKEGNDGSGGSGPLVH